MNIHLGIKTTTPQPSNKDDCWCSKTRSRHRNSPKAGWSDNTKLICEYSHIFIIGDKFLNTCRLNSGWAQDCVLTQASKDYPGSCVVSLEGQKLSEVWDLWGSRQTDSMLGGWMMSNFWLKSASHCRCQCSTKRVRFQAFTRLKYFWKKSLMFGFSTPKIWFCFLDLSADDSHACVSKLLHTCIGNLATIITML